ncbi:MAG: D-alanyl-D-alanine carboxypeptidase [Actinobacteria bacterium]|nr:D-alanyl-D-alanine carboxypeptidase [Actinomycetota bacterium]
MKIPFTRLIFAILLLVAGAAPAAAQVATDPPPAPPIGAASGILFDLKTGKILWAQNDTAPRAPASLTKIATALIAMEEAEDLNERVTITPEARNAPGGRMYAEQGWAFSVKDVLYGLLLQSGNDAAVAIAQKLSPDGTVEGFMDIVNGRLKELGTSASNFVNPHGYDHEGHTTTARDLALITTVAMRNPLFAEIVASKTTDVTWGDGTAHTFINHNKLLWQYEGTVGIKTGFTNGAGHCLASAVTRGDKTLVAILMGSPDHYGESKALYDWAFASLPLLEMRPVGIIRQVTKKAQESSSIQHGLEIVQLDGRELGEVNTSPASAPLAAPALALVAAIVTGTLISRRRRQAPGQVFVQEFDATMNALRDTTAKVREPVGAD